MNEYIKILEINPDYYRVWNNNGNALTEIKEYKKAIETHDKALEIKSEYITALYNKGIALEKSSKYKRQLGRMIKPLEIDPITLSVD